MNNQILSKKMNIILEKMGCSKTMFLNYCKNFDPAISKPTILNLINGNGKRLPSIETLGIVVKVCHTYGKGDLERLTFDYLLSDEVNELSEEHLDSYGEFGLASDTLKFFKQENTIGLFERDTMKGVNQFIPEINLWFFTHISVANTLVEILKRINWLKKDNANETELIAQIAGYLNTDYIMQWLKSDKCIKPYIKELESEKTVAEIKKVLFDLELPLNQKYFASKYLITNYINEYYLEKEGNLYKYESIELTKEELQEIDDIKEKYRLEKEEDKRKSDIRRNNKKKKEREENLK